MMSTDGDFKKMGEIKCLKSLNEYLSKQDNCVNAFYFSDISSCCKEFPCVLGIDEAGRGPVLGPMVYGTAFCPVNNIAQLEALECADSKALTEEKRDKIFENICNLSDMIGWGVEVISPTTICNSMLSRCKYSLNQVSMDSAIRLIRNAIDTGVNVAHVYVDTVGKPEKYQAYLETVFPGLKITVAKKADSTYPIVSAASICAKVTRDHALQVWDFQEGIKATPKDFGSGYPGDPVTKKFLVEHSDPVFGYPQLVRFSWSTAERSLENLAYNVEWEEIEEEVKAPKNTTAITSFLTAAKGGGKGKRKQHAFFKNRCLQSTKQL